MAILSVKEIDRKGSDRYDPGKKGYLREYLTIYRLLTDVPTVEQEAILASPLLPPLGATYLSPEGAANVSLRCIERNPENNPEDGREWHVTCRYSTDWQSTGATDPNPLLRPMEIRRELSPSQEVVTQDLYGDTLANSSDEQYDPPQTRDKYQRLYTFTMNLAVFDEFLFDSGYQNRTNNATWRDYPPFTAKIDGGVSNTVIEQKTDGTTVTYERVTITVRINLGQRIIPFEPVNYDAIIPAGNFKPIWRIVTPDEEDPDPLAGAEWSGWDRMILDQGKMVAKAPLAPFRGGPMVLYTGTGTSSGRSDFLLDGVAGKLSLTAWSPNKTEGRYHRYWLYDTCNFADLGI
jgi:hypothetical protein